MNFFNLTLSEKHFIFPSILSDSFAGYSNLGCRSLRLILSNVIWCALVCSSLGPASLGLSEVPGLPGSVFPLPHWESSPSLFIQITSSSSPSGIPIIQMLEHFKMSWRFQSLSSFFRILISSFFSGWMFLSSFWSTPLIWVNHKDSRQHLLYS